MDCVLGNQSWWNHWHCHSVQWRVFLMITQILNKYLRLDLLDALADMPQRDEAWSSVSVYLPYMNIQLCVSMMTVTQNVFFVFVGMFLGLIVRSKIAISDSDFTEWWVKSSAVYTNEKTIWKLGFFSFEILAVFKYFCVESTFLALLCRWFSFMSFMWHKCSLSVWFPILNTV